MNTPKNAEKLRPKSRPHKNMKRFSEQLHKQSTTVKLQAAEKRELRERLVSYMEYHPLPADLKSKSPVKLEVKTPFFTETFKTFPIPFAELFKYSTVAAAIILVVLPFVAEKAIPGDTLYAMKVQFNEELRATLTFDSYQKVEWETERVNRRIAEARLLASEGRLTEEVEAEVAQAVKTHTENAQREIEVLRTEDADGATIAAIALDTTLEVQSTSLRGDDNKIMTSLDAPIRQNNLIANVLDESLSQSEAKSASSTLPAYDKLMARAEQNTTRIYELLSSVKQSAPVDQVTDVTRRIQDIERAIQAAMELSSTDDNEARLQLVGVLQRTQKLIVYMNELEVTHSVDIESLVPVVLTESEEKTAITSLTDELNSKIVLIQERSPQVNDASVSEKVDHALVLLTKQASLVASSTDNFKTFKEMAEEALAIANDTLIIIEQHMVPIEETIDDQEATSTTETSTSTEEKIEQRASSTEGISSESVTSTS